MEHSILQYFNSILSEVYMFKTEEHTIVYFILIYVNCHYANFLQKCLFYHNMLITCVELDAFSIYCDFIHYYLLYYVSDYFENNGQPHGHFKQ